MGGRCISLDLNSHAAGITRVQNFLRQLQERLPDKRPAGIEHGRRALDIVPVLPLHLLHHTLDAPAVRDVGRNAHCFAARVIDGVDEGDVVVRVAGEEDDRIGGGEFAGDGGAGLAIASISINAGKNGMEG